MRTATEADIPEVLAIWAAADAEPTVTDDIEALRALLVRDPDALIVADDGELSGSLIVGWDGWRGAFYRLAVLPTRRHHGVGLSLVQEGERRLAAAGARRIALFCVSGDPIPAAFWTAAGYTYQPDRVRFFKNL